MTTPLTDRAAFEAAISGPPYERDIARWPDDAKRYGWPGGYKDINVSLASQMWQEAARQARAQALKDAAQECDALASIEGIAQRCAEAIRALREEHFPEDKT